MTLTKEKLQKICDGLIRTHCTLEARKNEQFTTEELKTEIVNVLGWSKYIFENAKEGLKVSKILSEVRPNVWATQKEKERLDKEDMKAIEGNIDSLLDEVSK